MLNMVEAFRSCLNPPNHRAHVIPNVTLEQGTPDLISQHSG